MTWGSLCFGDCTRTGGGMLGAPGLGDLQPLRDTWNEAWARLTPYMSRTDVADQASALQATFNGAVARDDGDAASVALSSLMDLADATTGVRGRVTADVGPGGATVGSSGGGAGVIAALLAVAAGVGLSKLSRKKLTT